MEGIGGVGTSTVRNSRQWKRVETCAAEVGGPVAGAKSSHARAGKWVVPYREVGEVVRIPEPGQWEACSHLPWQLWPGLHVRSHP